LGCFAWGVTGSGLEREVELLALIRDLRDQLAVVLAANEVLSVAVGELTAQVAALTARVGSNSSNSSKRNYSGPQAAWSALGPVGDGDCLSGCEIMRIVDSVIVRVEIGVPGILLESFHVRKRVAACC
jgi:hypothetical protein